jgi:DNA-binding CsgD family transcriptional regulator
MKNIYDDIGHPSKKNFGKICKLTEPLKLFLGVDRFWRNSHRKDGSYSVLGNSPPVAEAFFGQNLYVGHPYFRNPRFFQSGYALPELLNSQEYEKTQGQLRGDGNCHHVLIHIQKHEHGFIEYGFATSKPRLGFEAVYLNHLQAISKFIHAFEQTAAKLIQEADEYRVNISHLIGVKYHEKPQLSGTILAPDQEICFLSAIEGNSERAKELRSLTNCERSCLRHYLSGSTTLEIAGKLYRSPRTIETHLENAKAKLGINSRSKLFEILTPFRDVL